MRSFSFLVALSAWSIGAQEAVANLTSSLGPVIDLGYTAYADLDKTYNPSRTVIDARSWGPICVQQPAKEGLGVEELPLKSVWLSGRNGCTGQWNAQRWTSRSTGALFWIKRHISAFGGDPDEVTISGESAGGASVLLQATAWGGKVQVPFKRAIAQSIGLFPLPLNHELEGIFGNVTSAAGCPASGTEAMACLRAAPLSELIKSINSVRNNYLAPTIDGPNGFIPDLPSRLITQGKFRRGIDLIGGHTTNDGRNFAGIPRMDQHWVNATVKTGHKNAYSYRFNVPNPVDFAANPWRGVGHTSDVYYMFNGATGGTFHPFNTTESQ
ncbi:Alpha beta-hydrolase [Rhizoctonia solani]|uniref:Carboxylic ester hydrolase n=1 Tax=Rhizoctonia solani TaxID=456999 RepID=A0A8H7IC37_9AGAM|nr:Alpha beta-hydrolase [Rhizoctonia solani]